MVKAKLDSTRQPEKTLPNEESVLEAAVGNIVRFGVTHNGARILMARVAQDARQRVADAGTLRDIYAIVEE